MIMTTDIIYVLTPEAIEAVEKHTEFLRKEPNGQVTTGSHVTRADLKKALPDGVQIVLTEKGETTEFLDKNKEFADDVQVVLARTDKGEVHNKAIENGMNIVGALRFVSVFQNSLTCAAT